MMAGKGMAGASTGATTADVRAAERAAVIDAFLREAGFARAQRTPLPGDASFRRYVRLTGPGSRRAMLMDAPPPEAVGPFVRIARLLIGLGFSAPRILAENETDGLLLIEDFGDGTFTRILAAAPGEEEALYALAVDTLAALHGALATTRLDPALLPSAYDHGALHREAALLTQWFLPVIRGDEPEPGRPPAEQPQETAALLAALDASLAAAGLAPSGYGDGAPTLVLRDFHVDNLMRLDRPGVAACGLLDFQDGLMGHPAYDLVSLLRDARRDIDPGLAAVMSRRYLDRTAGSDAERMAAAAAVLSAQRNAKIIGIFTRLSRRDGKDSYLAHIPRVWRLLIEDVAHPACMPLRQWLDDAIPPPLRRRPAPRAASIAAKSTSLP